VRIEEGGWGESRKRERERECIVGEESKMLSAFQDIFLTFWHVDFCDKVKRWELVFVISRGRG
jgi:hypothetical protein